MKFIFRLYFSCLLLASFFVSAQEGPSYYVVVGVFSVERNAEKFIRYANEFNIPAAYAHHPGQNLYYVYVRSTQNKEEAFRTARSIGEDLNGAWVFQGSLAGGDYAAASQDSPEPETEPVVTPIVQETPPQETIITETPADNSVRPEKKDEPAPIDEKKAEVPAKPAGKPFIFKLSSAATGNEVTGEVHLLESDKANQYRGYGSNETVYVIPPNNRNGRWYIACRVVGYKVFKKNFVYTNPTQSEGVTLGPEQEVIFPITLTRVKKGDYVELDQVRFFTNSNVLTPESDRELVELYNMMNENPDYQIRLHGHTNGKEPREIVSLRDDQDLFSTSGAERKSSGTAKELSELRAQTVKKYLVSKGIEASRISVRGEGGTQMIFPPGSTIAGGNDRVEVEITRH